MRFLSTKVHGVIDYLMGIFLIAAPWLLGFANGGAAQWVPVIIGAGMLLYSIFTKYELGMMKVLPMNIHLMIDCAGGILLAASPWIFGFADYIYLPHLVLGILELGAALVTKKEPHYHYAYNK